jgi:hypothetical protein
MWEKWCTQRSQGPPYIGLVCSLFIVSSQCNEFILSYYSLMFVIIIVEFPLANEHGGCVLFSR